MPASIWTYTLPTEDGEHELNIPDGAVILGVTSPSEIIPEPTLIVCVDPKHEPKPRGFWVTTAGSQLPSLSLLPIGYFIFGTVIKFAFEIVDEMAGD